MRELGLLLLPVLFLSSIALLRSPIPQFSNLNPDPLRIAVDSIKQVKPSARYIHGIIIRMFMEAGGQHHRPHFHAYYGEDIAIYALSPIELIAGELPRRQQRFVEAWGVA
jgi:hypothetical protein